MLRPWQRCVLTLPPDENPLDQFTRERPAIPADAPLPRPRPPAFRSQPRRGRGAARVPVSAARAGARLRGWIRPFWAGCAVGGLVAGWLATGWMPMAPAGASAVVPDAGDLAVQTDRPRSEVITDELFAAPAALPPPALAVASGAPAPPPVRNLPPPARNLPAPVRSLPSAAVTPPPRPPAPARFEGSLAVHSTPARARVFVNGEPMGLTPVVITGLPIGSRAVRVEADDHEPWWSVVQVVAHRETSVRVLLPPAASAAAP